MSSEKDLEKKVAEYQILAKQNPNIDVSGLMINALQSQKQNQLSPKTKRWAYLISLGVPPLGILFALKFFFGEEEDAKSTAWTCIFLTAVALLLLWIFGKMFFSSTGVSMDKLQQIKPSDIQQLYQ